MVDSASALSLLSGDEPVPEILVCALEAISKHTLRWYHVPANVVFPLSEAVDTMAKKVCYCVARAPATVVTVAATTPLRAHNTLSSLPTSMP